MINVHIPSGARAILVSENNDGSIRQELVDSNSSVLNIERDIFDHLSDYPHSDAWLIKLRDYVDQRLAARAQARGSGKIVVKSVDGTDWQLMESA